MRRVAAVVMGGLFPAMAAVANCSAPETSADAGPPLIDGLEACVQACLLWSKLCAMDDDGWCAYDCEQRLRRNAGPVCRKEYDIYYNCQLAAQQAFAASDPSSCPEWYQCVDDARHCYWDRGCVQAPGYCVETDTLPCNCTEYCAGTRYDTKCQPDGTTSATCDCFIDDVFVGSCQTSADAACVDHQYDACCDQYFMLEF